MSTRTLCSALVAVHETFREKDMSIEVIGAGLGRTGTKSLQAALETLGYGPCYHMTEVFGHPEHLPMWEAATRGEPVEWERIFGGYRATVDWPGAAFYERLMEAYPRAKVILTVRDPERWYESVRSTIYDVRKPASSQLFSFVARFVPRLRNTRRAALLVSDLVWKQTFGDRFEDRKCALETFSHINQQVRERVPEDRLLVYEISEGWQPLCDFLGAEPPEGVPFPHLNDTKSFRRTTRGIPTLVTVVVVAVLLTASAAILRRLLSARSFRDRKTRRGRSERRL